MKELYREHNVGEYAVFGGKSRTPKYYCVVPTSRGKLVIVLKGALLKHAGRSNTSLICHDGELVPHQSCCKRTEGADTHQQSDTLAGVGSGRVTQETGSWRDAPLQAATV